MSKKRVADHTDVAHELRTPVTILHASCEEMADGLVEPTRYRLSSLHQEVLRLGRVLEDLEHLAAAEAARLQLDRRPVDLAAVTAQALDLLRPHAHSSGVTVRDRLHPAELSGDPDRLHQVATNLLANAIKRSSSPVSGRPRSARHSARELPTTTCALPLRREIRPQGGARDATGRRPSRWRSVLRAHGHRTRG